MTEIQASYAAAVRAARLTLALNLLLCVAKIAAGWLGRSFALVADGINNLTDVGVSTALYIGMGLAQRPADERHPYGHGKIEQELTRIVAIGVLVTGGVIIWEAVRRLGGQQQQPDPLVLGVAAVSIAVKAFMYVYQNRMATRLSSSALAADALNHKTDVAATSCVLVGTAAVHWGGARWASADELATLAIGLLMVVAAAHVIHEASSELLDQIPPAEVMDRVRRLAQGYPGVRGVDLITGRKTGMHYLIDLHLTVDGAMPVAQGHYLGHQAKDWIMHAMPEIGGIVVHVEPEDQPWKDTETAGES